MNSDAMQDDAEGENGPSPTDGAPHDTREALGGSLIPDVLREALKKKGFTSLTSVQRAVVDADTQAKDVRISSQTGSGKTVAVGLAIGRELLRVGSRKSQIEAGMAVDLRMPQVLLLTPTRELATQVKRELAWLFADVPDASVEVVTGGTSVVQERNSLARGPRVVVGTPGRVLDHLTRGGFKGDCVSQVILDEADQMFDMGFRDELEGILESMPKERRTHLVSATFSPEVRRIAERFQQNPVFLEGSPLGAANEDIEHVVHVVGVRHRYDALINVLLRADAMREEGEIGRTLIFTRTRADALEIAERLQRDGLRAEPLSGDLAQAQRTRTLSAFRSGQVPRLVATDVAARGLDVQGVEMVVHLDPPGDPDAYTHRSGRTGRAGTKGTSVLLLPPQARGRMERLLRAARVTPQWAPVPTAQKIRKLYSKVAKRKLYSALEIPATDEQREYAKKVLEEHEPVQVVARLLSMIDLSPPCLPREISEHIAPEGRGQRPADRGPRRPTDRRFDRGRPSGPMSRDERGEGPPPPPGGKGRWRGESGGKKPRPGGPPSGPKKRPATPGRKFR